jgi:hypothetical protein
VPQNSKSQDIGPINLDREVNPDFYSISRTGFIRLFGMRQPGSGGTLRFEIDSGRSAA